MSDSEVEYDITGALNPDSGSEDDYSSDDSDAEIQDIISDDEETKIKKPEAGVMSFPSLELSDDEEGPATKRAKNKKDKRDDLDAYFGAPQMKKGSAGSFAGLGLSSNSLKNIARKGFKQPTPIQRKTIPLVLEGRDVVGMARTGSGKTAAFVLPMLEKLKVHSAKVGARAVILSPSRELALQTLKVVKDFSAGTDLRLAMLVGGDSLEEQFTMMMSNPDIIIATPGRFLHLKVEMELSLASVEYIVFDEADRLFELGFGEQMNELLASLPSNRQTLLFSATLPKTLVEFAKAGLHDPVLVRLDAETKLAENLEMAFFSIKENQRDACLAFILKEVIKMPFATAAELKELARLEERAEDDGDDDEKRERDRERKKRPKFKKERLPPAHEMPTEKSTIVFCPTKHHVEYVIVLLQNMGYAVSYIYGTLDQHARKNQLYRFRTGKTSILVVTDVAARGIDVPVLANVINYSLPPSPKVFIHRVGRTARAGNRGWAYSIVKDNDVPYLLDLEVFLGRKLLTSRDFRQQHPNGGDPDYINTLVIGAPPREPLDIHGEEIKQIVADSYELQQLYDVAQKGERMYNKTKGSASQESAKRSKQVMALGWDDHHLLFGDDIETAKDALLRKLGEKRIRETVFEFRKSKTTSGAEMMATRREQLAPIQRRAAERKSIQEKERAQGLVHSQDAEIARASMAEKDMATEADLEGFDTADSAKKSKKRSFRDSENFMSHYAPTNDDKGYAVGNFAGAASNATFDLVNDGTDMQQKQGMRWDKKKGKFINAGSEGGKKFIRGEGGQRIAASFRSGRFDKWKSAHKVGNLKVGAMEEGGGPSGRVLNAREFKHNKQQAPKSADKYRDDFYKQKGKVDVAKDDGRIKKPQPRSELKSTATVRKDRQQAERRQQKNARPSSKGKGGGKGKRK